MQLMWHWRCVAQRKHRLVYGLRFTVERVRAKNLEMELFSAFDDGLFFSCVVAKRRTIAPSAKRNLYCFYLLFSGP